MDGPVKNVIVGITGASGVIYGIRLLEVLNKKNVSVYLVVSPSANVTIKAETDYELSYLDSLVKQTFRFNDIAAPPASGSFLFDAMVVIPCSMHTLGSLAGGTADNLITRASEVALKEKRKLILVPRETPMTIIHLENMAKVARAGAVVLPAMPAFYHRPKSIADIVDHLVGKVLDLLGVENDMFQRWQGIGK